MDDDRIQKARKILLHENFPKLTPLQVQDVYRNLIIQGITKEEISQILKEKKKDVTYLEGLPYNVFVNLVLVGEIDGRDLLNFCNSSPLINEKCNKAFISESGHVVPQFIFSKLLQKMGIPSRENPREQYLNIVQHRTISTLSARLSILLDLLGLRSNHFPETVYDLIYGPRGTFAFEVLEGIKNSKPQSISIVELLEKFMYKLDLSGYYKYDDIARRNIDEFLEILNLFRSKGLGDLKYNYLGLSRLKSRISQKDFSDANIIFAQALKRILEKYGYSSEEFRAYLRRKWNTNPIFEHLENSETLRHFNIRAMLFEALGIRIPKNDPEGLLNPNPDDKEEEWEEEVSPEEKERILLETEMLQEEFQRVKENLNWFMTITEDELDYLTYLHYKVYNGEIPVLESFTYENLFGY
jgi:hypothetical protein